MGLPHLTSPVLGGMIPRHLFRGADCLRAGDFSETNFRSYTVANSPQARKRARQNEKNRKHNASLRSMTRTYIKKVNSKIEAGNYEEAQAAFVTTQPVLDSMVNKGIYEKNKVARLKSRMATKIKALKSA
tara:strand:+ start:355 stop:744 length:390 start_codon:yes stop_codon:yes gene_type:complete